MKNVTLPVILAIVSVVLVVIVMIFTGTKDKTGPEIEYSDSCITLFSDSDDVSILLDGVKAKDKKDGDVSDSVRIQNITVLKDEGRIIVRYSAKDKDNNITEAERSIDYDGVQEFIDFSVLDEEMFEDLSNEQSNEASSEETTPVETEEVSQTEVESESTTEQEQTTESQPEESETIDRAEVDATGIPQIRMKYHELTIPVGGDFYFMDALADWYDDKDDVSRRVILLGEYDVNVPGVYEITYYVTDSDLHVSNKEKLVLTVTEEN